MKPSQMPMIEFSEPPMKLKAWKIFSFVALAALLGACSGFGNPFASKEPVAPVEPNVMPQNYRARLLAFLEKELADPSGVREAYIAEPKLQPIGNESRYMACVRYNAKNGYGQYVGTKDYVAIYFHGALNQYVVATPEQCAHAAYVPWPELEKLRKPGA